MVSVAGVEGGGAGDGIGDGELRGGEVKGLSWPTFILRNWWLSLSCSARVS